MFLVTFPQCPTSKEEVIRNLSKTPNPLSTSQKIQYAEVAQESHKDGGKHLHVFILFSNPVNVKSHSFFNPLSYKNLARLTYQGNIKGVDSLPGTLDYIRKEDNSPLVFGSLPHYAVASIDAYHKRGRTPIETEDPEPRNKKAKQASKSDGIALAIKGGATMRDVDEMSPGFLLQNLKRVREYMNFVNLSKTRDRLKAFGGIRYTGDHPQSIVICRWLNQNLLEKRIHKQKQLYLWGRANSGKTSVVLNLMEHISVYWMPFNDPYCTSYDDDAYDLVVFDEFRGPNKFKSQPFINQFLEGVSGVPLPNRYEGLWKFKNQPVIICSNFPLAALYVDSSERAQMEARVIELQIEDDSPIDFENFQIITLVDEDEDVNYFSD